MKPIKIGTAERRDGDIDQSVKDRLKNLARSSGKDYNLVCIQYMHERFLAGLEQSDYKESSTRYSFYLVQ